MSDATPHVFVSYASADHARVASLAATLERAGVRVWLDRDGIPGGANYGPEIVAAIKASAGVLLCCSAAAFASRNVRQEVALAWTHERPVLPLLLERVAVPDDLAYWLEAAQWLKILDRTEGDWLPEVARSLKRFGVAAEPPPPAAPEVPTGKVRLPAPLTALLGRDAEAREVAGLLASHRLVTLTGPGGVGKTRLAIEAARMAAAAFPDGIGFVDLAPVRDPALVLPTLARDLGVQEAGVVPLADALAAAVGDRRLLSVLDNMEQVLDAAPGIAALLSRCPHLAVLATSRAPLGVRGEHVVPVAPLAVPATGLTGLADLAAVPAVALFIARAAEARPGFALTGANAATVAGICARLDGLPLALELAGARAKLLPPDVLLARLDHALSTLTGGARDLPDRQRTLRDAIAWSHDLLAPDERVLFRRLGVFVGGWTLEAAEAVGGGAGERGEGGDETVPAPSPSLPLFPSVLDSLGTLIDNSLLRFLDGQEPRFGMLETIREYALERLEASGEAEEIRGRHADWCLDLTERVWRAVHDGAEIPRWLSRSDVELNNVRAALGWLERSGDDERLLRLAVAINRMMVARGHHAEAVDWLERALALAQGAPPEIRMRALSHLGRHLERQGHYERAWILFEEVLAVARELDDPLRTAYALGDLGLVALNSGRYHDATPLFDEAKATYRRLGRRAEHWISYLQGIAAYGQGDIVRAAALVESALAGHRALGDEESLLVDLDALALLTRDLGDNARAAALLEEALPTWRKSENNVGLGEWLAAVARLAAGRGRSVSAARLYGAAEALFAAAGVPLVVPPPNQYRPAIDALRTALGADAFAAAWAAGRSLSLEESLAESTAELADVDRPAVPGRAAIGTAWTDEAAADSGDPPP